MQQEQIKTLLVNLATGALVVAVLVVGYSAFVKKEPVVSDLSVSPSVKTVAQTTALIGLKIGDTVASLEKLNTTVENATAIFNRFDFTTLVDLSVEIPRQKVSRENPFVPTEWKLKIRALEESMRKSDVNNANEMAAPAAVKEEAQAVIQEQVQESVPSDVDPDASQNL